jgi:carbonic anhydrase
VGSWLVPLRQLAARHDRELLAIPNHGDRADRLSEINVAAKVENVIGSPAYREALRRDAPPKLHGWVFDLATGYLREVWPRL